LKKLLKKDTKNIQDKKTASNYLRTDGGEEKYPAILSIVEKFWIEQAFLYFDEGKDILYFVSDSTQLGPVNSLNIKHVYFKPIGQLYINAIANFVDFTLNNPSQFRLPGSEDATGKYYYGFTRLEWIKPPLYPYDLTDLKYFKSNKNLRTDVMGAPIIIDPYPNLK
jgi:hypothetical protein